MDGLVSTDQIDVAYTTSADESSPAGDYAIEPVVTASEELLANYSLNRERRPSPRRRGACGDPHPDPSTLRATYDGRPHPLLVHVDPLGAVVETSYVDALGTPLPVPVDAGTYSAMSWVVSDAFTSEPLVSELVIDPAPVVVQANPASRAYGGLPPNLSGTITGLVAADGIFAGYSTPATATSAVGAYPIDPHLTDPNLRLSNYTVTLVPALLAVSPAPLSIRAPSTARNYGATVTLPSPTFVGFVNGDTTSALTGVLACTTPATRRAPVGLYAISCSGATSANYAITYLGGTLTVRPAPLVVTARTTRRGPMARRTRPSRCATAASSTVKGPGCSRAPCGASPRRRPRVPRAEYPVTCSGLYNPQYATQYVAGYLTVSPPPPPPPPALPSARLASGGKGVAMVYWAKVTGAASYTWELYLVRRQGDRDGYDERNDGHENRPRAGLLRRSGPGPHQRRDSSVGTDVPRQPRLRCPPDSHNRPARAILTHASEAGFGPARRRHDARRGRMRRRRRLSLREQQIRRRSFQGPEGLGRVREGPAQRRVPRCRQAAVG